MTLMEPATVIAAPEPPDGASDHAACLSVLLDRLDWHGSPQDLAAALTASPTALTDRGLRATMANLGFVATRRRDRLGNVPAACLPCLFMPDKGALLAVLVPSGDGRLCFDAGRRDVVVHDPRQRGAVTTFARAAAGASVSSQDGIGDRLAAVLATVAITLLTLGVPLAALMMLDLAAPRSDTVLLLSLGVGVVLALVAEFTLRGLRGALFARRAGRRSVGGESPGTTPEGEAAALDLAATPAALIALAGVAGTVVWLPAAAVGLALLVGFLLGRHGRRAAGRGAPARDELATRIGGLLGTLRAARARGVEALWYERLCDTSAAMSAVRRSAARRLGATQALADSLTLVTVGAVLLVLVVPPGDTTPGTLLAAVLLSWRALAPAGPWLRTHAQPIPANPRPPAAPSVVQAPLPPRLSGRLAVSGVTWSPPDAAAAVLQGVSFLVRSGESVALSGSDGAGKSALLRLIAGLAEPDQGAVRLDGVDLGQLDGAARRRSICYVTLPLTPGPGTVADAVRAANPVADDDAVREALEAAGVREIVEALPDGLETPVGPQPQVWLSTGLRAAVGLAGAYLSEASLVLIDDVDAALDVAGEAAFRARLNALRGRRTVVFATHRPGLIAAADRILILRRGRLAHDGTPGDLVRRLARPG